MFFKLFLPFFGAQPKVRGVLALLQVGDDLVEGVQPNPLVLEHGQVRVGRPEGVVRLDDGDGRARELGVRLEGQARRVPRGEAEVRGPRVQLHNSLVAVDLHQKFDLRNY